jgi:peptidoglycan/LPS O-acetylase OafA/YrhL
MFKHFVLGAKIVLLLAGAFLILFALDVFELPGTWYQLLLGFLYHALPGLIVLALVIGLWKHPLWLGIASLIASLIMIIVFGNWQNFPDLNYGLLPILLPMIIAGGILAAEGFIRRKKAL